MPRPVTDSNPLPADMSPDDNLDSPALPGDLDGDGRISRHERFELLEQAAIEAELETGRREQTVAGAKRSILVRIISGTIGGFLIVAGVVMLVIPGPGLLAIALGLGLIAPDVPFAARLLDRVKDRLPQDADGKLPTSVIVGMSATAVVFTAGSLWFAFGR